MREFTTEQFIEAAQDLNVILGLNPPIVTEFETKAKGAAKTATMNKFVEGLKKEIIDVSEGQDPETKKYDLQITDLPVLKPETIEIVKELSPAAAERLIVAIESSAAETKEKKEKPVIVRKQSKANFVAKYICDNPDVDAEKIQKALETAELGRMADSMLGLWIKDMKVILDYLKETGKLQ